MTTAPIEWGAASWSLGSGPDSGDQYLIRPWPDRALVAVVDGLGHGADASAAARIAVRVLTDQAHEPVITLFRRCHESLRPTRGAVLSLAVFDVRAGTMTWMGVGNVEGVLLRANPGASPSQETLLLRPGVMGGPLPPLYASILAVAPGDTLVLATDGIGRDFARDLAPADPPQGIADRILSKHRKATDDALVLVARYLGGTGESSDDD